MIISVHIPKTAGTSFGLALKDSFGERLKLKYGDRLFNMPVFERNKNALLAALENSDTNYENVDCIHGHFLPVQFLLLKELQTLTFVTWMRNPVERIISDYYHTLRSINEHSSPLQQRIIKEKWSLKKYCLCEVFRNVYSQFLWGFPLENFDFIGITEYYSFDIKYLSNIFLGTQLGLYHENVNKTGNGNYCIDKSLKREIESFHARDMALYHKALQIRNERLNNKFQANNNDGFFYRLNYLKRLFLRQTK
jgi:hypothetical protein